MGRFGGWQARWLASVIMMTGEGKGSENGMRYSRESPSLDPANYMRGVPAHAEIYTIGIVDIDESWLCALIPEINRRDKFLRGDESGFYAE